MSRAIQKTLSKRRPGGFTLIEVLLAATIFAITSTALFVTFRTGLRAWRTGHAASETFQTIRIAQDVILRDLHNIAYQPDAAYNKTFREQLPYLPQYTQNPDPSTGESRYFPASLPAPGADDDSIDFLNLLQSVSPPVDLSLSGQDNGELDTLTFTRHMRSQRKEDEREMGLKRIRYYVEDGILYREESSVYGFNPSEQFEQFRDEHTEVGMIASLFSNKDDADAALDALDPEANVLPDDGDTVSEPLCEGVELFNITYGLLRNEGWQEVSDWDSGAFKHRFPPEPMFDEDGDAIDPDAPIDPGDPMTTETTFMPRQSRIGRTPDGRMIRIDPTPDNLPGYFAIQIGIRDVDGRGKLRSFTIVVSNPLGREEVDPSVLEELEIEPSSNIVAPVPVRGNPFEAPPGGARR